MVIFLEKFGNAFKNRFWKSFGKLLILLAFMFIPLILNIGLALIPAGDRIAAILSKIIPGEMVAYCLGLIAPLFVLMLKTNGKGFSIPALPPVFIFALILYIFCVFLTLVAKNGLIEGIDNKPGHTGPYFWLGLTSLFCAIVLRLFTDYQESRLSDYKGTLEKQEQTFSNKLAAAINEQQE